MLPASIATGFAAPVPVRLDINGDGRPPATFMLRPLPVGLHLDMAVEHGVCTSCWGAGFIITGSGEQQCANCGGQRRPPELHGDFRRALIRHVVAGWQGLLGLDDVTGEVVEIPYSEQARDALALMIPSPYREVIEAAQRLAEAHEAEKKDSQTSLGATTDTGHGP